MNPGWARFFPKNHERVVHDMLFRSSLTSVRRRNHLLHVVWFNMGRLSEDVGNGAERHREGSRV